MKPSTFILASLALVAACASTPDLFPSLQQAKVQARTERGTHDFSVWIAADHQSQERGLMFVRELPPNRGMLFVFESPREAAFWMRDTYLSLDIIFIGPAGRVLNIAPNARPLSLDPIESHGPAIAVLEVLAGTAWKIDLKPGDTITLPTLQTTGNSAAKPPKSGPVTAVPR
jgi:uncharacterized membrane protein (UPF0127 family)